MGLLLTVMLFAHLLAAVIFVGGSFFMWLVVVPVTRLTSEDEVTRGRIVAAVARRFGVVTNISLIVLAVTGAYNATWYLPGLDVLSAGIRGGLLALKVALSLALFSAVYVHGVHYGRKISRLTQERRFDELKEVRRRSMYVSFVNLVLMVAVLLVAVMMQFPP
ncbi:MAG: hypothetical protein QXI37_04550 [Thermoprotei archaeon]